MFIVLFIIVKQWKYSSCPSVWMGQKICYICVLCVLHMLYTDVCVSHSVMSDSLIPQSVSHQAPLSMGFSRQEY